jgi:hypothetical protein
MYTMEYEDPLGSALYWILDPDDVVILAGLTESEANGLLSHLNRGQ